jgi:hypothetical protein
VIQAYLFRQIRSDHGTEGQFIAPGFSCFTLELTWKDNRSNVSCIPAGVYTARLVRTPKHGLCFMLHGVAGRFAILIHSGNFAGDIEKGLRTHSQGCLLFGKYRGTIDGQRAVLASRPTVRAMQAAIGAAEFQLTITDPFVNKEAA